MTLKTEFTPDGSKEGGGTLKLFVNDKPAGEGQGEALALPPRVGAVRGRPRLDHADRPGLQGQRQV